MWRALFDIYYNFFGPHRPQIALYGLIALAFITSINTGCGMVQYGSTVAFISFLFSLFIWATVLPCVIFLIDAHRGNVTRRK